MTGQMLFTPFILVYSLSIVLYVAYVFLLYGNVYTRAVINKYKLIWFVRLDAPYGKGCSG